MPAVRGKDGRDLGCVRRDEAVKLKELFRYTGEEQTIELIINKLNITAPADALKCFLTDKVLEGTITVISADDNMLVVCADCEDDD